MPTGWFRIATRQQVPPGKVAIFRINGQEVVAFRNRSGELAVVDPYCPHMGAHLGHGGTVRDGALRCPFHGLRFGIGGQCVGSEYPGSPEVKLRLRAWPVVEQLDCIFAYAGANGETPAWSLPTYDADGWAEPITEVLELKGHIQDIAENAVDFGHFGAVHQYSDLLDPTITLDGPHMHSKFGFTRRNPLLPWQSIESTFDTMVHGLGLSVTDLTVPKLGVRARVLLTATQLDRSTMSFGIGISSALPPPFVPNAVRGAKLFWALPTQVQMRVLHRFVVRDVIQDKEIWAHRRPTDDPALIRGDGPIPKFRRWVKQFYPSDGTSAEAGP